ncbi:MAG: hypothetical protein Q9193_005237 [Seirophora villosa]
MLFTKLTQSSQAGHSCRNDALEAEAYQKQKQVNRLLQDSIGTQFIDKRKQNNWVSTFGLSAQTDFISYANLPGQCLLQFENGGNPLVCNWARRVGKRFDLLMQDDGKQGSNTLSG